MNQATPTSDRRLIKGARARATIARHAADVASLEGLTGLSLGRLAADLELSKSGVATLFGTKENLQLAAVQAAREVFVDHVVRPAMKEPVGMARLHALVDGWFDYIAEPVFPGGCFRVAVTAEFDSRSGPVHDAVNDTGREWIALLESQIRSAQDAGQLAGHDPYTLAFHLDAVVSAANTSARMGDSRAIATARSIADDLLSTTPGTLRTRDVSQTDALKS